MDSSRENATRLDSEIYIKNILRILLSPSYNVKELTSAPIFPRYRLASEILTAIGGHLINQLTRNLRMSRIGRNTYRKILSVIK